MKRTHLNIFLEIGRYNRETLVAGSAALLKPTEAAVVAGVSLREVNRVIDEGILPDDFLDTEDGRRIAPSACFLIAFYIDRAERLTRKERRFVIDEASARLRKAGGHHSSASANQDWVVTDAFLAANLSSFVDSVGERWKRLSAAKTGHHLARYSRRHTRHHGHARAGP